jgi:lipooligosaccharide transport system permease protein
MAQMRYLALPLLSLRFLAVWRRHFLVWKKLAVPSILGNLADPMIVLFGLGYGLGAVLGDMGGTSYFAFIASGFLASTTMYAATFESLFSAFSRMHVQKTWEAIVNAPMTLDDVLAGEWVWAASKSLAAGLCVLLIVTLAGYASYPMALATIPAILLIGLTFGALGLCVNALASGYDFFTYYMTLLLTPMMMLSGVFFPVDRLPGPILAVTHVLPLYHGVELVRPLLAGRAPAAALLHIAVLAAYALAGFYLAAVLTRRRLLT